MSAENLGLTLHHLRKGGLSYIDWPQKRGSFVDCLPVHLFYWRTLPRAYNAFSVGSKIEQAALKVVFMVRWSPNQGSL